MDNRFRFRVWDKEKKIFVGHRYCYLDGDGDFILSTYKSSLWIECAQIYAIPLEENINRENYIVQQCTGLKDCDGKLIFEGDLLKFYDNVLEVKWSDYGVGLCFYHPGKNANPLFISPNDSKNLKIIGNIFEDKK